MKYIQSILSLAWLVCLRSSSKIYFNVSRSRTENLNASLDLAICILILSCFGIMHECRFLIDSSVLTNQTALLLPVCGQAELSKMFLCLPQACSFAHPLACLISPPVRGKVLAATQAIAQLMIHQDTHFDYIFAHTVQLRYFSLSS